VLHIAQGGYTSSINYMAANGTSSHFIVSAAGSVSQMVDTDDTAWGNGLAWCTTPAQAATLGAPWQGVGWYCPHKHKVTPSWADITPGVNPNLETISIEHEGMSGRALPAVQLSATVRLLAWLAQQCPSLAPYAPGHTLIRHADIDPTDKAFCPGPAFDLALIARLANEARIGRYRVKGLPVYQRQELDGPLAGELPSGTQVDVDMTYANGAAHLASNMGFVRLDALEAL
jgi:hypothetical protein